MLLLMRVIRITGLGIRFVLSSIRYPAMFLRRILPTFRRGRPTRPRHFFMKLRTVAEWRRRAVLL